MCNVRTEDLYVGKACSKFQEKRRYIDQLTFTNEIQSERPTWASKPHVDTASRRGTTSTVARVVVRRTSSYGWPRTSRYSTTTVEYHTGYTRLHCSHWYCISVRTGLNTPWSISVNGSVELSLFWTVRIAIQQLNWTVCISRLLFAHVLCVFRVERTTLQDYR